MTCNKCGKPLGDHFFNTQTKELECGVMPVSHRGNFLNYKWYELTKWCEGQNHFDSYVSNMLCHKCYGKFLTYADQVSNGDEVIFDLYYPQPKCKVIPEC